MISKKILFLIFVILVVILLAGCTANEETPTNAMISSPTPESIEQQDEVTATIAPTLDIQTSVPTATVEEVTEPELQATAIEESTDQGNLEETPDEIEGEQPPPTPTPTPSPTPEEPVSEDCLEKAAFFADVTVPDGTFFYQGESFTKTWRFRNEGTCTWTTDYSIVFYSGDNLSAPIEVPFPETVPPGEQVDLSVDMKAPTRGGQHQSNWEFEKPAGERFGAGSSGKDLFWVLINVRFLDENDDPQPDPSTLPPPETPPGCEIQRNEAYESQVVDLVNQARAQNGLDPLTVNSQLTAAALAHSVDMACNDFVGHSGSDGSHWTDRISVQGYSYSVATENIYVGFPEFGGTPEGAFEWWMNSQVHRDNILDPDVTEIGVGYVFTESSSYGGYYTINFAHP